jgi:methylthioribose-1-phosphate isomerase
MHTDFNVLENDTYDKYLSPLKWEDNFLKLLDQRILPHNEEWLTLQTKEDVYNAIKLMVVRGAPAIGITGAFGVYFSLIEAIKENNTDVLLEKLQKDADYLKNARPTAVNLSWAIDRMINKINTLRCLKKIDLLRAAERETLSIWAEDINANIMMGSLGLALIPENANILTHCNAGAIATGGYGTALGVIRAAHDANKNIHVFSNETRPWLQGARLTAWELNKLNIPVTLIPDSTAGYLMSKHEINLVIVGADRIALNGDVANKIGTYTMAVLAHHHNIPFYVAAPVSTIDILTPSGKEIPVEERDMEEVLCFLQKRVAPDGVCARNPVFDITPNHLINAIITEKGIIYPPFSQNIRKLFN